MPRPNLIPGAAESWTVSDDGKVYTFKLRKDGAWSNGDPVTADDFVYSFRRLHDPATGGRICLDALSRQECRGGQHRARPSRRTLGVKAIDANTLEITLKAPTPYFLEMLTHQATYPVNKASIEKLGADWIKPGNLVSNGAYTLAEFVPNDHIKLVKNPKFHDAAERQDRRRQLHPDRGPLDRAQALRGRRARLQRRHADRAARRPQAPSSATRSTSARISAPITTPSRPTRSRGRIRSCAAPSRWRSTATSWPRRCGRTRMMPGYSMVPPGIKGYDAGHGRLCRRCRSSTARTRPRRS